MATNYGLRGLASRRPFRDALGVTIAVVSVVACSSGSGPASKGAVAPSTTTTTTLPLKVPDTAELTTALLTVPELPVGWGVAPPQESNSTTNNDYCDGKANPILDKAGSQVSFSRGGQIPLVAEGLAAGSEAEMKAKYSTARAVLEGCFGKTWKQTDQGSVTTFTSGAVSMPSIGDESFGARLTGTTSFGVITIDVLLFRKGTVEGAIVGVGGNLALIGGGQIEPSEYETIAKAADKRLSALFSN